MLPNGSRRRSTDFGAVAVAGKKYAGQRILPTGLATPGEDMQYAPQHDVEMVDQGQRMSYFQSGNIPGSFPGFTIKNNHRPVQRRISRACDQCNQLRTRCDGKQPCAHCTETGLPCEYARAKKKRGKASRKDVAAQQTANPSEETGGQDNRSAKSGTHIDLDERVDWKQQRPRGNKRKRSRSQLQPAPPPLASSQMADAVPEQQVVNDFDHCFPRRSKPDITTNSSAAMFSIPRMAGAGMSDQIMQAMNDHGSFATHQQGSLYGNSVASSHDVSQPSVSPTPNPTSYVSGMDNYGDIQYEFASSNNPQAVPVPMYGVSASPRSAVLLTQSQASGSPAWVPLSLPSTALYPEPAISNQSLRYPVLQPLVPYIASFIPLGLACDLLELYFTSTSSIFMHPQSPYILGYVFRKRSFLRQDNPRLCSPALLASILWVAAQTSESALLSAPPSARANVCQQLLELTVDLSKPLVHVSTNGALDYSVNSRGSGVTLGGFGVCSQDREVEGGSFGASGTLDYVATYLHLATVVSASEFKAASLRWWNAAWSLARELKLGRELPATSELVGSPELGQRQSSLRRNAVVGEFTTANPSAQIVQEEEREERRRLWWLLYAMDRHLALCYNRPLFLLDTECSELLRPVGDLYWQAGDFYEADSREEAVRIRGRGPPLVCTGHSIFGYFLPLMTILGEIVELNQARNHPRFGLAFNSSMDWTEQVQEISRQLEAYGQTLKQFEARCSSKRAAELDALAKASENRGHTWTDERHFLNHPPQIDQTETRIKDCILRTKTVVAYGTYLMHTLQILLNGKWDPISLLDDNDLWISSPSFVAATGHAVSASEALNDILDYDPDLSFMPFFFGIYLLQGSFLQLLIADRLQGEASPQVVQACETIVRAHEACIVTLSTEYQKNFRKVMRSALSQVKGRMLEEGGEQEKRRREVLGLYRWTNNGTGLAL